MTKDQPLPEMAVPLPAENWYQLPEPKPFPPGPLEVLRIRIPLTEEGVAEVRRWGTGKAR